MRRLVVSDVEVVFRPGADPIGLVKGRRCGGAGEEHGRETRLAVDPRVAMAVAGYVAASAAVGNRLMVEYDERGLGDYG